MRACPQRPRPTPCAALSAPPQCWSPCSSACPSWTCRTPGWFPAPSTNTVWNQLTGRPPLTGINDIDLFYFDASDLSYEAEDRAIKATDRVFADLPLPVQLRNQARVHLWYPERFGEPYPALTSSREAIDRFASLTHAVGARLDRAGEIELYTPFGLDDLFSFRIAPNRRMNNRATHEKKAERARSVWPEIVVEAW